MAFFTDFIFRHIYVLVTSSFKSTDLLSKIVQVRLYCLVLVSLFSNMGTYEQYTDQLIFDKSFIGGRCNLEKGIMLTHTGHCRECHSKDSLVED